MEVTPAKLSARCCSTSALGSRKLMWLRHLATSCRHSRQTLLHAPAGVELVKRLLQLGASPTWGPTPVAHLSTLKSRLESLARMHSHTSSSSATGTDMLGPVRRKKAVPRGRAGADAAARREQRDGAARWARSNAQMGLCERGATSVRLEVATVCVRAREVRNRDRGRRAQVVRFYDTMERAVYPLRELPGSVRAMPMPRSATYRRGVIEYACLLGRALRAVLVWKPDYWCETACCSGVLMLSVSTDSCRQPH
jgi:hypothetical protein